MSEADQRKAVVAEALSWVGTPWRHNARVKGAGVDCGQLLVAVYAAARVAMAEPPTEYPQEWALHRGEEIFLRTVERHARKAEPPYLPGDIALFKFGRCLSHAGIVVEWPTIVHAYLNAGLVLVDGLDHNTDLAGRFAGCWSPWHKEG